MEFEYKLGWAYGRGAGCDETVIGQYVNRSTFSWRCTSGCSSSSLEIGRYGYICSAANSVEQWELGDYTFRHTFSTKGPYTIKYVSTIMLI